MGPSWPIRVNAALCTMRLCGKRSKDAILSPKPHFLRCAGYHAGAAGVYASGPFPVFPAGAFASGAMPQGVVPGGAWPAASYGCARQPAPA